MPFKKTHSMVCAMDFRSAVCAWCRLNKGPIEDCIPCPRFRKYELKEDLALDASAFCELCKNKDDSGLRVFCETNRKLQKGSGEPFDCYKYDPDMKSPEDGHTHVVTVFLSHLGKVCLVRRSEKVGTYKGRWSGISGHLEGDPGEHFMVELREETSLKPGEYALLRRSETVVIPDEQHERIWFVHPFLCEVLDPSRITLDWENTELRWIDPEEMKELDTVPGLWEVYERVSRLPLERDLAAFVKTLKEDRDSGARQLAVEAVDFLGRTIRESNAARAVTLLDDLFFACREISMARPSMGIISTSLDLLLQDVQTFSSLDIGEARSQIALLIAKHLKEMEAAPDKAVEHLGRIMPEKATVLLHSYSSSLIRAFPLLREKQCSLIVTESRPGFEGRTTAHVAAEMGLKVRLVTDACAGHELLSADMVLMGADSIEPDGSVINKAGSSLIAAAAHALGIKVYFIGELRKISFTPGGPALEEYDPDEVWENPPSGIEVGNLYFDRTRPQFISGIIMEKGAVEPGKIREIAGSLLPLDMNGDPRLC